VSHHTNECFRHTFLWDGLATPILVQKAKLVTRRLGQEAYLLVVQIQRADVNAPGGQFERSIDATRGDFPGEKEKT
jgi:hypothetical protein